MKLHNVTPTCSATAPVAGGDPPPTDAVPRPAVDWSVFGLTMTIADIQTVTHDSDSGIYERMKSDADFPRGFSLSDAPRAKKLWWTYEVAAYVELRAAKFKAKTIADSTLRSTNSSPISGDGVKVFVTPSAVGAEIHDFKRTPRRGGQANSVGKRSAVRAQRLGS